MIMNMVGGGGGVKPILTVYVDTGTLITVTKGSTTLTGTSVSGSYTFNLPEFGTWSVTITSGSQSVTDTVTFENSKSKYMNFGLPIGGRIFYINPNSTGATYRFWDSSNNEITGWSTISDLAQAAYYSVSGTPSADKFYVYDTTNGLVTDMEWGASGTSVGVTSDGIGLGKTNSDTCLETSACFTPYTSGHTTIWTWLRDSINENSVGGCNDWYIGSEAEQNQLKASGLVDWYSSNSIWSSVEKDSSDSYYWWSDYNTWTGNYGKSQSLCAVAMRSF